MHSQRAKDTDASGEFVYAGQGEHGADPLTSLYKLIGQAVHAPPCGPVYPLLHRQFVCSALPVGEVVRCANDRLLGFR